MPAFSFSIRGSRLAAAVTAGAALGIGALGLAVSGGSGGHVPTADQVKAAATVDATAVSTTPLGVPPVGTTPTADSAAASPAAAPSTPSSASAAPVPSASSRVTSSGTNTAPDKPAAESSAEAPRSDAAKPALDTSTAVTVGSDLGTYTAQSWTAKAPGPVREVTGHDITLNECANVHGAATWQQQPYLSSGGNPAVLETYTFGTAAGASAAYQGIHSGMSACQATSRTLQTTNHLTADALSHQTAGAEDTAAFARSWSGVAGISAPGSQTNHLFLATRGTSVLVLHFDELAKDSPASGPYDVRQDPNVLSLLTNLLATQAGAR
ncbi:hypothetical protein [Streptomyces sp. CBMA156]|uniref:hypothetical protein n=1 Tax=Streptomyces sp. CBMA156 TaxID=1930280 RepID=UPI001661D68C|nr:hypothetical protein [Streptomyces sp. CBMA156]